MRYSQMLIRTAKEIPAEAEVISHQLLLRAGCIRKLTSGLYTYLPLGLAAIKKVEAIDVAVYARNIAARVAPFTNWV